jgi:hypothetical protein
MMVVIVPCFCNQIKQNAHFCAEKGVIRMHLSQNATNLRSYIFAKDDVHVYVKAFHVSPNGDKCFNEVIKTSSLI